MSISLFQHNQIAYEAALSMLTENGKAAIIHPTGTGKSFIGFKLCEDSPDATVCWLSPSEYIFKTQVENWVKAGGSLFDNIVFFTYSKLMSMEKSELEDIKPAYIILDEFHRCGAEMWGQGVQNLLGVYPNCPVLGLSATNIRYLDNQRDMADELFDGNIASQMTLGEAIVRGILNPPKYVLSVFSYEKDYQKYKTRVEKSQSPWAKDKAERILLAMQRALERADGIDVIFDKHMIDRTGKYIVFCANFEHMKAMIAESQDWFRNHIPVLSEERIAALESIGMNWFTRQERLWEESFSIVESYFKSNGNLDGLAAFSPKAYTWTKSQRQRYRNNLIPKEQVERLTAVGMVWEPEDTWQLKYEAAREYYFENGNLDIPATYVTGSGVPLGGWYRAVRSQYRDGILSEERIRMLEEIGINWVSVKTRTWMRYYEQAKDYLHTHGDVNILSDYVTENGMRLGVWISGQRYAYSKGKLPKEQIRLLEEIGISWDRDDSRWDVGYSFAQQYYSIHGNINVPTDYVTPDGYALGQWINMQRTRKKQGKVADKRIKKLDALGMLWDPLDAMWQLGYDHAKAYFMEHGDLKVPARFIDADGFKLGSWISNKRTLFKKGALSEDRIQQLNGIGMMWSKADYKKEEKQTIIVPRTYDPSVRCAV